MCVEVVFERPAQDDHPTWFLSITRGSSGPAPGVANATADEDPDRDADDE